MEGISREFHVYAVETIHDVLVYDVQRPEPIAAINSYASPTPAIEAGRLYVHYGTYGTACLDTALRLASHEVDGTAVVHAQGPLDLIEPVGAPAGHFAARVGAQRNPPRGAARRRGARACEPLGVSGHPVPREELSVQHRAVRERDARAFDLGEAHKVAILSVTEGEDKPLKYPDMFHSSDICLINKIDLLPHLDFDVEKLRNYALQVNPDLRFFEVSATTGEGMQNWYEWLKQEWQGLK